MNFINKLIDKVNFPKIFIVGFIIRFLVNYFIDINVFIDYIKFITIIYCNFMYCFITFVNEIFYYFQLHIFPLFKIFRFLFNSKLRLIFYYYNDLYFNHKINKKIYL